MTGQVSGLTVLGSDTALATTARPATSRMTTPAQTSQTVRTSASIAGNAGNTVNHETGNLRGMSVLALEDCARTFTLVDVAYWGVVSTAVLGFVTALLVAC